MAPREAVETYLQTRKGEVAESTLTAHRRRLKHFVRWCEKEDLSNLNELSGRDLQRYRNWRRDDGGLNKVSLKTQLSTLRVFLQFCEKIDGVTPDLHEKIIMPSLAKDENTRDAKIEPADAMDVLDYLRKYEYAKSYHVAFELLWHTELRIGALRSLDLEDFHSEDAYLELKHRPEQETPLKNKEGGERLVGLKRDVCRLLEEYIQDGRPDVTDEYGREPLLATIHGRPGYSTIRK